MQGIVKKRTSLKKRLVLAFLITSIVPIVIILIFSYYNTSKIVRENVAELSHANLIQLKNNLNIWLDSYEDILFQVYMDDDIVSLVENINKKDSDNTLYRAQLRRTLRGLFYTKEYIRSISIIAESGEIVFYDLLTGKATKNSWMDNFSMDTEELYKKVSANNDTHFLSTEKAGFYNSEVNYLFHLGHRVIDYKNVNKQLGVVIVSIDERLLKELCNNEMDGNSMKFMVDKEGFIVSYPDNTFLGQQIDIQAGDIKKREEGYFRFVREQGLFKGEHITMDVVYDEDFECDIIKVSNQNSIVQRLNGQNQILLVTLAISVTSLIALIMILTRSLTSSLHQLVAIMKRAGRGDLSARVEINSQMLQEVETIAEQFNHMLVKVENSLEKEKEAGVRQKNAEIATLEAQINPHFLYNTLDTINWMAIEREAYEISNSITSLAAILRYGIHKSNEAVMVRQECDWLKQYLFLQQTRLKNTFECELHVAPEILEWTMHKLILQPFIENAILHGFEGKQGTHRLEIQLLPNGNFLEVEITDNGKGISKEKVHQMNKGIFPQSFEKQHIGMENAITRIQMYYGSKASVMIESEEGMYTSIKIKIPHERED